MLSGGPLSLIEGRLKTASNSVNHTILNFVIRAIGGHSGSVSLPMRTASAPYIMQSMPIPGKWSAYLFVRNSQQSLTLLEQVLPELFGLTAAEIRAVKILVQGKDLQAAGEELNLSRNTVRNHLQNIFQKTNTQSRPELLVQILCLIDH